MENISQLINPKSYKLMFDLKGSTVNRKIKLKEQFWNNKLHFSGILKDLNFIEISKATGNKLIDIE